ncbi:sensor histidine kinase [Amycolatopsis sp. H20-H5]|uniref:sensor histidine kinase n=1 Tax=Amycolatopsis sp. H20-H5 TaxID=3046309 RepID=UPI002DBCC684|nr:histidine kinase [Amycolatopsis sp. H20-H5]MEC3978696.1 histidine kinase [Amycolatopsis sp. H20-H5]
MIVTDLFTSRWTHLAVQWGVIAIAIGTVLSGGFVPGSDRPWQLVYAVVAVCLAGELACSGAGTARRYLLGMTAITTGSIVLASVGADGCGALLACQVAFTAGFSLSIRASLPLIVYASAGMMIAEYAYGQPWSGVLGVGGAIIGIWLSGSGRRQYLHRVIQTEALLAETRRAADSDRRAAALGERARIAREIHDIQAHSLSALSLQLEAAGAMLQSLPPGDPKLVKIMSCVDRASGLAREGLIETSRAVQTLREDAVELPGLVDSLLAGHTCDDDRPVRIRVHGQQRDLPPGPGLALYRAIQEGLTNIRKHAPGTTTEIDLDYHEDEVTATVTNSAPDRPATPEGNRRGYGLTGIRERAELAGGTLEAGPADGGWRLHVRIPA